VRFVAMGRREEEHGTFYPQSPVIDLPEGEITREALAMIAERWRVRRKADEVALFHTVPGKPVRECEIVVKTVGWDG